MLHKVKQLPTMAKEFFETLGYCMKVSWMSSKFYTLVRFFTQIFSAVSTIIIAYFSKRIIDFLSQEQMTYKTTMSIILAMVASMIAIKAITAVFDIIGEYTAGMHNEILTNYLQTKMMEKAIDVDMKFFDTPTFYDTLETARRDTTSIVRVVWNSIYVISSMVTVFSILILFAKINIFYGIVVLLATIPSAIADKQYTEKLYGWGLKHVREERQMNYLYRITTSKEYASDIRLYENGESLVKRFSETFNTFFTGKKKMVRKRAILSSLFCILPEICVFFILANLASRVLIGQNTIGDFSFCSSLLSTLFSTILLAISNIIRIYEDKLKIDNTKRFQMIENDTIYNGTLIVPKHFDIVFDHVSFIYPKSQKEVLSDISFKICDGERICLVGVNGSGKSTIIKLILRFYDVTSGEILINGINIQQYDIHSLRKSFSTFFQQFVNYAFTLRENITISDNEKTVPSDNFLEDILKFSEGGDILKYAPHGFDTYMTKQFNDDGIELSGGQLQKLALARTFYRNSSMIILDEPSAALDPEAEYYVFQSLKKLCAKKTVIFTSHRLSNVTLADRIIVIEHGKIIESGTHEKLIYKKGRYSQLYNYQANHLSENKKRSFK